MIIHWVIRQRTKTGVMNINFFYHTIPVLRTRRHSCRNATIGSICAARRAGK